MKLPNQLKISLYVYWQARYEYFIYEDYKRSNIPESWALVSVVELDIPIDVGKVIENSLEALERERQKIIATAAKEEVEIQKAYSNYLRLKWQNPAASTTKEPEYIPADEVQDDIPF